MRVQQRLYRTFFAYLRPAQEVASSGKDRRRGPEVSQLQEHLFFGEQGRFRSGQSRCWWGSVRSGRIAGGVLRKQEGLCYLSLVWALVESWGSAEEKDQVAVGASPPYLMAYKTTALPENARRTCDTRWSLS